MAAHRLQLGNIGLYIPPYLEISLRKSFGSRDFFWSGRLRCTTHYFQTRGASVWILSSLFTNRIHLKHKTPRHWKNLKPIICYTWYNVSLIHRERRSGKLTPAQEKHLKATPAWQMETSLEYLWGKSWPPGKNLPPQDSGVHVKFLWMSQ